MSNTDPALNLGEVSGDPADIIIANSLELANSFSAIRLPPEMFRSRLTPNSLDPQTLQVGPMRLNGYEAQPVSQAGEAPELVDHVDIPLSPAALVEAGYSLPENMLLGNGPEDVVLQVERSGGLRLSVRNSGKAHKVGYRSDPLPGVPQDQILTDELGRDVARRTYSYCPADSPPRRIEPEITESVGLSGLEEPVQQLLSGATAAALELMKEVDMPATIAYRQWQADAGDIRKSIEASHPAEQGESPEASAARRTQIEEEYTHAKQGWFLRISPQPCVILSSLSGEPKFV